MCERVEDGALASSWLYSARGASTERLSSAACTFLHAFLTPAVQAAAAVLVALAGVEGVAQERDVTTLDMSVQPQYTWDEAQRAQRITGYIFSQRLQVGRRGRELLVVLPEIACSEAAGAAAQARMPNKCKWHVSALNLICTL